MVIGMMVISLQEMLALVLLRCCHCSLVSGSFIERGLEPCEVFAKTTQRLGHVHHEGGLLSIMATSSGHEEIRSSHNFDVAILRVVNYWVSLHHCVICMSQTAPQ